MVFFAGKIYGSWNSMNIHWKMNKNVLEHEDFHGFSLNCFCINIHFETTSKPVLSCKNRGFIKFPRAWVMKQWLLTNRLVLQEWFLGGSPPWLRNVGFYRLTQPWLRRPKKGTDSAGCESNKMGVYATGVYHPFHGMFVVCFEEMIR